MAERNCKNCFHYKACKEIASHNGYGDICYTESQCKNFIFIDNVVKVVRCRDCKYFYQDGDIKVCKHWNCHSTTYDAYCSYAKMKEDEEK